MGVSKTALLLGLLISVTIAKPQIEFGESEASETKPIEPESAPQPESASVEGNNDNELVHTRLGLLAGYLSKLYF